MLLNASWFHELSPLQWGVVLGASLVGAICDVRSGRIPNRLTGPLLLGGLLWAIGFRGLHGLADAMVGSLLLLTPFLLLFLFAHGGAGDAKLMGAIGMWAGVINGVAVLLCVVLAGAVLGVGYAVLKAQGRRFLSNLRWMANGLVLLAFHRGRTSREEVFPPEQRMTPMPYGVAILAGVCLAMGVMSVWHF